MKRFNRNILLFVAVFGLSHLSLLQADRIRYSGKKIVYDNKNNETVLTGNARVYNQEMDIKAGKIKLNRRNNIAKAYEDVRFFNKKEGIRGGADFMIYDINMSKVFLYKSPFIVQEKENLFIKGDVITAANEMKEIKLFTNVIISNQTPGSEMTLYGQYGFYNSLKSNFFMSNHCRVISSNMNTSSDRLTYSEADQKAYFYDHVTAEINDGGSTNIIKSHYLYYDTKDEYTYVKDNASITNQKENFIIYADEFKQYGVSNKIYANGNVVLYNQNEKSVIQSKHLMYDSEKEYTFAFGDAYLSNQSSGLVLYADRFERFEGKDILYAKGHVECIQDGSKAFSTLAVYKFNEKKAVLYGNPYIAQGRQRFYAERVVFYSESKKVILENQVAASLYENY